MHKVYHEEPRSHRVIPCWRHFTVASDQMAALAYYCFNCEHRFLCKRSIDKRST